MSRRGRGGAGGKAVARGEGAGAGGATAAVARRERQVHLRLGLILLALLGATLAAYFPAWNGGLLWDDEQHLTRAALQSLDGLRRIWFEAGATQQYYPVTHSAFWLQHALWGGSTLGYHLVSIVLHALSAFLVGLILRRLAVPGAWLAAAVFALHPVHVESVAWIAELKNTLSGALCLGAALAYLRFDESRRRRDYAAATALFVVALLGKTVTGMLPVVLLVVAWWRRGRVDLRRDARPLVPLLALGGAAGLVTAWVERTQIIGTQAGEFSFTFIERCAIAGRAAWFYLGTLLWPSHLVFIYPRWEIGRSSWAQLAYPVALLALFALLWRLRGRARGPLAALLAFCAALFPALGFVNVYPFRFSFVADHFQYLASIPIVALVAAGLATVVARVVEHGGRGDGEAVPGGPVGQAGRLSDTCSEVPRPSDTGTGVPRSGLTARSAVTFVLLLALCLPLAALTWRQAGKYADAATLYQSTLLDNPACWLAHVNLGTIVRDANPPDYERAAAHFRAALRLRPSLPEAHYGLAMTLQRMRRLPESAAEYREAIRLDATIAEAHGNLCNVLREMGQLDAARAECEQAVALNPEAVPGHRNLAVTLQALGRVSEAVEQYRDAVRRAPDAAPLHYETANALQVLNRLEESAAEYREALRLQPVYPEAVNNLGFVLQKAGRVEEALACYREALRLKPDYVDAYYYLGNALQALGRPDEAAAEYARALDINPSDAAVHNNLGLALEATGRPRDAAEHYATALRLRPDLAQARLNLARVTR